MSRALGMVRSHVKGTLENLTAQAGDQVNVAARIEAFVSIHKGLVIGPYSLLGCTRYRAMLRSLIRQKIAQ